MRHFFAIGFSVTVAVAMMPKAMAGELNAGDILEISFSTTTPVCPAGTCDVLQVFPNEFGAFFDGDVTASLFDGNNLLGTYFNRSCCVPAFASSSSLFQGGSTVDFTAIDSGSINGIMDISIATGFLTWPSEPTPSLIIGHATGAGVVMEGTGIQVDFVAILSTPEPSTLAILLVGLMFLRCRARFGYR